MGCYTVMTLNELQLHATICVTLKCNVDWKKEDTKELLSCDFMHMKSGKLVVGNRRQGSFLLPPWVEGSDCWKAMRETSIVLVFFFLSCIADYKQVLNSQNSTGWTLMM